jgi:hypothetical protein
MGFIHFVLGLIGGIIGLVFGLIGGVIGLVFGIGGTAIGLVLAALALFVLAPIGILLAIIF